MTSLVCRSRETYQKKKKNGEQNIFESAVRGHWTTEMEEKLTELRHENECLYNIKLWPYHNRNDKDRSCI